MLIKREHFYTNDNYKMGHWIINPSYLSFDFIKVERYRSTFLKSPNVFADLSRDLLFSTGEGGAGTRLARCLLKLFLLRQPLFIQRLLICYSL